MLDKYLPSSAAAMNYFNKHRKLPVEAAVKSNSEPFHWHDEQQFVCVLRGVIEVQVNNKFYLLKEDEIILINDEDVHRINVMDASAAYISLHLDLKYIEETLPDISYIWYSCDPTVNTAEKEPALCRLRSRIAQILLELKDKRELYENRVLLQITSLLNILINNFNLTGRDPDSYKDNEQFERMWSIIDYIYMNSAKRISLKDVATHVHLSDSYLSHCIKDNTGMSFEELLNFFRAEISIKKLLTTNLSITRISYDCGFSDTKYYNKYFQKFFNCSPLEYRNKNKLDVDISLSVPASEAIVYDDFLMGKLRRYISEEQPNKLSYEDVITLDIDVSAPAESCTGLLHYWQEYVDVGDKSSLLDEDTQWLMYDVMDDIKFTYIRIHNLIDEAILLGKTDPGAFNWGETFEILDFVRELGAYPMVVLSMGSMSSGPGEPYSRHELAGSDISPNSITFLFSFITECRKRYGEAFVNSWRFVNAEACLPIKKFPGHLLYDTVFMAPYFIDNVLNPEIENFIHGFTGLFDYPGDSLFHGGTGILTSNGLKKPLYHAYHLLSCTGEMILSKGENHLVTRSGDNIQILLYNLPEHVRNHPIQDLDVDIRDRYADFAQDDVIHFNITMNNLNNGEYLVKNYKLDSENGSIFDRFKDIEAGRLLSERDASLLNSSCYPRLKVSTVSNDKSRNVKVSVPPNSVEFITLKSDRGPLPH